MRRVQCWLGGSVHRRIWLGGINLLPYRAGERRRIRVCRLLHGAAAAVCACVWVALSYLPDLREAQQAEARRIEIERGLAGANTVARSRLSAAGADQLPALMASRALLLDGFDLLGSVSYSGVRLHALHGDARGFSIRIEARDPSAAQVWLARLRSRWPRHVFEIEDLRAAAAESGAIRTSPPKGGAANSQTVTLTVRMQQQVQAHADESPDQREQGRGTHAPA